MLIVSRSDYRVGGGGDDREGLHVNLFVLVPLPEAGEEHQTVSNWVTKPTQGRAVKLARSVMEELPSTVDLALRDLL